MPPFAKVVIAANADHVIDMSAFALVGESGWPFLAAVPDVHEQLQAIVLELVNALRGVPLAVLAEKIHAARIGVSEELEASGELAAVRKHHAHSVSLDDGLGILEQVVQALA